MRNKRKYSTTPTPRQTIPRRSLEKRGIGVLLYSTKKILIKHFLEYYRFMKAAAEAQDFLHQVSIKIIFKHEEVYFIDNILRTKFSSLNHSAYSTNQPNRCYKQQRRS